MLGSRRPRLFFVYIMASRSKTLYTGVTSDLARRTLEHRFQAHPGFTSKYNITRLVYFESTSSILSAIAREKNIKGWSRAKKVALIESLKPSWEDLTLGLPET